MVKRREVAGRDSVPKNPLAREGVIMGVDPGGTIGVAWAPVECVGWSVAEWKGNSELVGWEQIEEKSFRETRVGGTPKNPRWVGPHGWSSEVEQVYALLKLIRGEDVVKLALESFVPSPRATYTHESWSPIRQNAMVEFALRKSSGLITYQTASQAKSVMTDVRLRRCGLDPVPRTVFRHARDGIRHLVLLARRVGNGEIAL